MRCNQIATTTRKGTARKKFGHRSSIQKHVVVDVISNCDNISHLRCPFSVWCSIQKYQRFASSMALSTTISVDGAEQSQVHLNIADSIHPSIRVPRYRQCIHAVQKRGAIISLSRIPISFSSSMHVPHIPPGGRYHKLLMRKTVKQNKWEAGVRGRNESNSEQRGRQRIYPWTSLFASFSSRLVPFHRPRQIQDLYTRGHSIYHLA